MLRPLKLSLGPPRVAAVTCARGRAVQTPSRARLGVGRRRLRCRSAIEEAQDAADAESVNGNGAQEFVSLVDPEDVLPVKDLRKHLKPRPSPFGNNSKGGGFVGDNDVVAISVAIHENDSSAGAGCAGGILTNNGVCIPLPPYAKRSGPRRTIYYEPELVTAAVVTCGGLCPGLNDVVQNIVFTLNDYGVPEDRIYGIKYGLRGFYDRHAKPIELTRNVVEGIQLQGGTILGTSRGGADIKEIVRRIKLWNVNMLFVVGGNGGNAAANAIHEECERQGVITAVVGVPKSIDNDILLIDRCFGFDTAVEESQRSLVAAMVEASSADKGVGLVRLMGRQSGYIAMQASMASGVVDICLIPEVKFSIPKLIEYVEKVFAKKGYCVICVAEGAGQDIVAGDPAGTDPSGNPILKDIGTYLKDALKKAIPGVDVKYIDPTYMIRAIPTNSTDRIYCKVLGQGAVHGAFAGYTDFTIGLVNTHYVFLPIPTIIQAPRTVNPSGREWSRLRTALQQPEFI